MNVVHKCSNNTEPQEIMLNISVYPNLKGVVIASFVTLGTPIGPGGCILIKRKDGKYH